MRFAGREVDGQRVERQRGLVVLGDEGGVGLLLRRLGDRAQLHLREGLAALHELRGRVAERDGRGFHLPERDEAPSEVEVGLGVAAVELHGGLGVGGGFGPLLQTLPAEAPVQVEPRVVGRELERGRVPLRRVRVVALGEELVARGPLLVRRRRERRRQAPLAALDAGLGQRLAPLDERLPPRGAVAAAAAPAAVDLERELLRGAVELAQRVPRDHERLAGRVAADVQQRLVELALEGARLGLEPVEGVGRRAHARRLVLSHGADATTRRRRVRSGLDGVRCVGARSLARICRLSCWSSAWRCLW